MKFIIEPINDTDCRIVDIDCSDMQGRKVAELSIPSAVELDGKTWTVREVANGAPFVNNQSNAAKIATLGKLKKLIISEGIERLGVLMANDGKNSASRGNADTLTEVVLPYTLKVIGTDAFRNCPRLKICAVPDSVEEIEGGAFADCQSLQFFQWPKSLKKVVISAFKGMKEPEEGFMLEIPDSIETIENTWRDKYPVRECKISTVAWPVLDQSGLCETIESVVIPEGVRRISGHFYSLRQVNIPSSIEEIGPSSFGSDKCHTEVVCSAETMKRIMGMPGALNNTHVQEIIIPHGISEIEIRNCPHLTSLSFPSSGVSSMIIVDCPQLDVVELDVPDSVTELRISNVPVLVLRIPDSVKSIADATKLCRGGFNNLHARIEASPKVWNLILSDGNLQDYHPSDKTLTLPEGVEKIREQCFWNARLTTINFPHSLREIETHAFVGSKLKNVVLPEGLVKIGQGLFHEMKNLQYISFPASIASFDEAHSLATSCPKLKYVIFMADTPSTACYPKDLDKTVDWYVPDHMVEYVNGLLIKGDIKAKSILPLSGLSKGKSAKKKDKSASPTASKPVRVEANGFKVKYRFAVDEADMPMLKNDFDRLLVAMRYMQDKLDECSLSIEMNAKMNFHIDNGEWMTVGSSMAVECPSTDLPQYKKELPKDARDYLTVSAWLRLGFEFKVDDDELVDHKKIKIAKDNATKHVIPYGICYGKRFIPVSSIVEAAENITVSTKETFCNNKTFKSGYTREHKWLLKGAECLPLLKELFESVKLK